MQLYCRMLDGALIVVAFHDLAQAVPASAYGEDAIIVPHPDDAAVIDLIGKPMPEIGLPALKAALGAQIDAQAEALRLGWITGGTGQAMEYQEAQAQAAAAIKASSSASEAKYPMLAATIGIDIDPVTGRVASDVLGVARSVQAARDAWLAAGATIRAARLRAKASIDAAGTPAEAVAAARAVAWSTPGA